MPEERFCVVYCCPTAAKPPVILLEAFRFLWDLQVKKRADERTRTADLLITSELLYLLSYVGLFGRRVYRSTGRLSRGLPK